MEIVNIRNEYDRGVKIIRAQNYAGVDSLDTVIFISLAFWGIIPPQLLLTAILTQWIFKVVYEVLATPITYAIVNALKRAEGIDVYDRNTNFNPFARIAFSEEPASQPK